MNALLVTNPPTDRHIDLAELLAGRLRIEPLPVADLRIDSRAIRPGDAFVAVPGRQGHGLAHVAAAGAAGASVFLYDARNPTPVAPAGMRGLAVPELDSDLAELADRAYRSPSAVATVTGITGTNGKTTTAWLIARAQAARDGAGAYIGTLGSGLVPDLTASMHTTPDVFALQAALRQLVDRGATNIALEVSSQGLDQRRTDGVRIYAAGFTNLSRDHLDYHGTMQAYADAKRRLFATPGLQHAVINVADAVGADIASGLAPQVILTRVGVRPEGASRYVLAERLVAAPAGLVIEGSTHLGRFRLESRLLGRFNAENLTVALGLLLAQGWSQDEAIAALAASDAPPGRMERWRLPSGALAVVDYAHTPDALEKALMSLREHTSGTLWCVFGCGGDRDKGKRPAMGAVAERHADRVVLTDDNPRSESPAAIVADIESGMRDAGRVIREHDRRKAIATAVAGAGAGDLVLVAGMGHEEGQTYAGVRRPYSDRLTVAALAGAAP